MTNYTTNDEIVLDKRNTGKYSKKVLLLEKSGLIKMMLKDSMYSYGITQVYDSANIDSALNIIRKEQPQVICMSYTFYEIDNRNIFYDISIINPNIKIFIISSTPMDELDSFTINKYNIDVFDKSTNFNQIASTILNY